MWLAAIQTSIADGTWIDPGRSKITVSALAERWVNAGSTKRQSTKDRQESILRLHILPVLGKMAIGRVTPAQIQSLVDTWTTNAKPSTVGRQYNVLRAIFEYAVRSDMLLKTPCRGVWLPAVALVTRPQIDTEALGRLAISLGPNYAPMMWLGVVGGLRWAEAAGLQVRCLDLLRGVITIKTQLNRQGVLDKPKTPASIRNIAIPDWLCNDLAALLAKRGITASDDEALVFTSPKGGVLDYSRWRQRIWVPACEKADISGLRFHDLRSWAATALIVAGVDVKTAQVRLGHADPHTTLAIYARASVEADQAAAKMVGDMFNPLRREMQ